MSRDFQISHQKRNHIREENVPKNILKAANLNKEKVQTHAKCILYFV